MNDGAALDRQEIIATTVLGKADVREYQPSCDECGRPADGRRVGLRCAGYDFYLPLNLCLDCQTRIGAAIKRKLKTNL